MEPVDPAQQPNTPAPVDSAQAVQQPVTAPGSTPVDNATNPTPTNSQVASPQTAGGGPAGAGVDDEPIQPDAYDAEKEAFLRGITQTAPAASAAPVSPAPAPAAPAPASTAVIPPATPEDELEAGKPPRFNNVRTVDAVDVQALAAWKAAVKSGTTGGQSMVNFMAQFASKNEPAAPVTPPPAGDAPPGDAPPAAPQTLAEINAEVKRLREQERTLTNDFDFDGANRIKDRIDELQDLKLELLVQQSKADEQAEAQQLDAAAQADAEALARVAKAFPQTVNAHDPLVTEAGKVLDEWAEQGHALLEQPNRYWHAYVEAAARLSVNPQAAPAAPSVQPTSTPTPVNRPPVSALIAGGDASSTTLPRAPVSQNLDDYEAEKARLLAGIGKKAA